MAEVSGKLSLLQAASLGWKPGQWVSMVVSSSWWHHCGAEEPPPQMGREEYALDGRANLPLKTQIDRETETGFPRRRTSRAESWLHQSYLRRKVCLAEDLYSAYWQLAISIKYGAP